MELTHFNEQGRARMVDVSEKPATYRTAHACATVRMARGTMEHIRAGQIGKGDVLAVAQVAGIMAAKKNAELIPMCKAVQRDMVITDVRLLYKDGGKSGTYEVK